MEAFNHVSKDVTENSVEWINLPVELWVVIFKNLSQTSLLFVVRKVCHFFCEIVFDPMLWKQIDMNTWDLPSRLSNEGVIPENPSSDDVNCILDALFLHNRIQSTTLFIPVVNKVHHTLRAITFSQYNGDFKLGTQQLMVLCKCNNLEYLDAGFCDEINLQTLHKICSHCSRLRTLILEGCRYYIGYFINFKKRNNRK